MFHELLSTMTRLDQPVGRKLRESVDAHAVDPLYNKFKSGEISFAEFKSQLDDFDSFEEPEYGDDSESWDDKDDFASEYNDDYADMDESIAECGDMPGPMGQPMMAPPQGQQDSVNMNVNMSGQGAKGIRDLMDILKNIDDKVSDGPDLHPPMNRNSNVGSQDEFEFGTSDDEPFEEFANAPHEEYSSVSAITNPPSDDLHKQKRSYSDKPYRGDNPMAIESIRNRLSSMYSKK